MSTPTSKNPLEPWLLLMIRHDGKEVLVNTSEAKYTLPQVLIPAQQRIAANINRAVERELGLRVMSLYEVIPPGPALTSDIHYHAVAAVQSAQIPPGGYRWACLRTLKADSFLRDREFAGINTFRLGLKAAGRDLAAEPFRKPAWFTEVKNWVGRSLRPYSLRPSGKFEQLNACPTFSLIRFETNREPVWFKAVGKPNIREWAVTLALAGLCPDCIPRILASRRRWNAWLALQAPGKSLASSGEPRLWERTAVSLASLQVASLNHGDSLLVAGAHDLRVSRLLSILEPFFQFIADSTRRLPLQTSKNLTLLEVSELKDIVRLTLQELDGLRLFDTVGHMDLSPANIFGSTGRAVFLDWAEAFVGDPLFSFEYLLQHFRRKFSRDAPLEERFRNAYLKAWRAKIPPKHLERALLLSPLSALFGYAATIWASAQADSAQLPSRERYLLSLVRKMKDEVPQMEAGRGLR
jgi:hypothetical protein